MRSLNLSVGRSVLRAVLIKSKLYGEINRKTHISRSTAIGEIMVVKYTIAEEENASLKMNY